MHRGSLLVLYKLRLELLYTNRVNNFYTINSLENFASIMTFNVTFIRKISLV